MAAKKQKTKTVRDAKQVAFVDELNDKLDKQQGSKKQRGIALEENGSESFYLRRG